MTYEGMPQEKIEQLVRKHLERQKRRRELRQARKEGLIPPVHSPRVTILPHTEAHRILNVLDKEGPKTSSELGAGVIWGTQHTSAQILRLLDYDFIDRDVHGVYSLTDKGHGALEQLNVEVSHTSWLQ